MTDHEQQIRQRAHRLWEEAGCPEGRDEEFWHAAERAIGEEQTLPTVDPRPPGAEAGGSSDTGRRR